MSDSQGGRWDRVARGIGAAELFVASTANVIILVTIFWNVLSRYALKTPVAWAEDITSIAFAWLIFVGAAAVHSRRGQIGVDLLTALLPERIRLGIEFAAELFVLVFCVYAAYLCWVQTVVSHTTSKTTVLDIPLSVQFASLTLGFALMALGSAFHLAGIRTEPAEA